MAVATVLESVTLAAEKEAKFWLRPVRLAANYGFNSRELNEILGLVEDHFDEFLEAWNAE